jgi:hypothetical protein
MLTLTEFLFAGEPDRKNFSGAMTMDKGIRGVVRKALSKRLDSTE